MFCPKCGFEQPDGPECLRCGVIVSRYKGPVLGATARPAAAPPPFRAAAPPVAPEPSLAAGAGTLYDGPAPAAAGGGTVYGGTMYDGATPELRAATAPAFKGSFEVGKILGEAFSIYFSNFVPFALLTALVLSPSYLAQAFMESPGSVQQMSPAAALSGLALLLATSLLCPYIATGAITYGVFQQMRRRDASIGECLGRGLASLLPIIFVAIIQTIGIMFGVVLCIVPGILLALRWAVCVPAAVEERQGAFDALSRSRYLTDGYRGEVFGILFVLGILMYGSVLVVNLAAARDATLALVLSGLSSIFTTGLSATATAVMYYRLRSVKESIDVDQIASVFA